MAVTIFCHDLAFLWMMRERWQDLSLCFKNPRDDGNDDWQGKPQTVEDGEWPRCRDDGDTSIDIIEGGREVCVYLC